MSPVSFTEWNNDRTAHIRFFALSMDPGPSAYDYTEGASAIDISVAVSNSRRSRQDSQHSLSYDEHQGTMFDGPGHGVNPSSVSRMSLHRPRSRRQSGASQTSGARRSTDFTHSPTQIPDDDDSAQEEDISGERLLPRRGRRSPSPRRTGVFGGIAHLFGRDTAVDASSSRRRTSISQHSRTSSLLWGRRSEEGSQAGSVVESDGDDRWGYSSGEEDEPSDAEDITKSPVVVERAFNSYPPSPTPSISLPLLSGDQLFGNETRIDIDLESLDPPPPGAPSRQTIYLTDEDVTLRFVGYEVLTWHSWAWRLACVLSLGTLGLIGHWFPRLWLRWVAKEKAFKELLSGIIVIEVCCDPSSFRATSSCCERPLLVTSRSSLRGEFLIRIVLLRFSLTFRCQRKRMGVAVERRRSMLKILYSEVCSLLIIATLSLPLTQTTVYFLPSSALSYRGVGQLNIDSARLGTGETMGGWA